MNSNFRFDFLLERQCLFDTQMGTPRHVQIKKIGIGSTYKNFKVV